MPKYGYGAGLGDLLGSVGGLIGNIKESNRQATLDEQDKQRRSDQDKLALFAAHAERGPNGDINYTKAYQEQMAKDRAKKDREELVNQLKSDVEFDAATGKPQRTKGFLEKQNLEMEGKRADISNKALQGKKLLAEVGKIGRENSGVIDPSKIKDDEYRASQFYSRGKEATEQYEQALKSGFDPLGKSSMGGKLGASVTRSLPNMIRPEVANQAENAEKAFLAAILRKESGAAISPSEYSEYGKIYFPRPGDNEAALQDKMNRRQGELAAIRNQGQRALDLQTQRYGSEPIRTNVAQPNLKNPSAGGLLKEAQASGLPRVGVVEDGYRYLGGPPGDRKSWQKVP